MANVVDSGELDEPVRLRTLVAPYRGRISTLAAASLASALMEALFIVILTAVAMALVSEEGLVGPIAGRTFPLSVALLVAAVALLLRVTLSLVAVWVSASLTALVTTAQRRRLSHAYLRASWSTQQKEPSGRLQQILTTFVDRIAHTVETLTKAIAAGLSLIALLATGVAMDPLATGAVLVALGLVAAILTPLRRAIRARSRTNSEASLHFARAVSELGALGQEMQTFGVRSSFEEQIDQWTAETTETKQKTQRLQGSLPHVYLSLAYGAVLVGVAILPLLGISNLSAVGAVMLLMLRSLSYGQQLATASASLTANHPFLDQVARTLKTYGSNSAEGGAETPTAVVPLVLDDVSYSYMDGNTALAHVSFEITPGETIGVIGPSGSGKSSLAQILLGLRSPTRGEVRVDGVPMPEVDRGWWTDRVAFVAQEALLFTGTIAENIRFFREGIDDATLHRAAKQANIFAEIEALPHGFDTHLGERGGRLSGGQKQRLSIARALAGNPNLLILDEPTSALDAQSEMLIRETLTSLQGSFSIVIIAHRMSTLQTCDRIVVLEQGRLSGMGSPTELLSENSYYRNALAASGLEVKG